MVRRNPFNLLFLFLFHEGLPTAQLSNPVIQQTVPSYSVSPSYLMPVQGPPYSSDPGTEALIQYAINNYAQYEQTLQTGQRPPAEPCAC